MKPITRIALMVLFAVIGIACWIKALEPTSELAKLPQGYQLQFLQSEKISPSEWKLLEQEEVRWVLAREIIDTVTCTQFGRSHKTAILEIAGDMPLLFSSIRMEVGAYPMGGNTGCVIDAGSAYILFGDVDIIGKVVQYGKQSYTITGVLRIDSPLLLVWADKKDFAPTSGIYLPDETAAFPKQELASFLGQYGFETNVVDRNWTITLMRFTALLPALACCIVLGWCGMKLLFPHSTVLRLSGLAEATYLSAKCLRVPLPITKEMLPANWSDFSFWGQSVNRIQQVIQTQWTAPGSMVGYLFLEGEASTVVVWSALAFICLMAAIYNLKIKIERN